MIKTIEFDPAYDKRNPDPKKNYGIHGVDMIWLYGDPENVIVQFVVATNWYLPHVQQELQDQCRQITGPFPVDFCYHSVKARYDGQTSVPCNRLTCGRCFSGGSSLSAQRVFNRLVAEGHDAVWQEMSLYYNKLK